MSKGGGTNSTIDPRLFPLLESNYKNAQGIAAMPYQAYTGSLTPEYGYTPGTAGTTTPTGGGIIGSILRGNTNTTPGTPGGWAPLPDSPTGTYLDYARNLVADPSQATQQGWNTIAAGAMDAGLGALNSAVGSASGLTNFQAPQMNAAWSGNYAPAATETANAPHLPTAHGFSGAAINRGDVSSIAPQSGLGALDAYMNPYTSGVIDASLNDLNRARQLGINQNASNATLSHAFGGDRQAVTDAETNRAYLDAAGRTIAGLRNQGFDTAAGLLQSDQANNLRAQLANQGADLNVAGTNTGYGQQAGMFNASAANNAEQFGAGLLADIARYNAGALNQGNQFNASNLLQNNQFNAENQQQTNLANQNAGLAGAGIDLQSAGLLGNLAGQQQNQFLTGANSILGIGGQQSAYQQALLDAAYQQFLRQQGYPVDMQQVLNSALGMFGQASGSAQYTKPTYAGQALAGLAGNLISPFKL